MPQTATIDAPPTSPYAIALREALRAKPEPVARFEVGELSGEVIATADAIFAIVRRDLAGGLAIRAAFLPFPFACEPVRPKPGEAVRLRIDSAVGEHLVAILADRDALERMRVVTRFTPAQAITLPFAPRDLYPLGKHDDPLRAEGQVEASQRGINTGLLYFTVNEPAFGSVLYVQNLTVLNDYFRATGTKPREAVGGAWPELGYDLPRASSKAAPAEVALRAGETVTLSDAILVFRHDAPPHERESARRFVQMLGAAYRLLDLPPVEYRD